MRKRRPSLRTSNGCPPSTPTVFPRASDESRRKTRGTAMYRSQKLALRYFAAAITLFGVMTAAGLLSALYYIDSSLLYNVFDFHMAKILHIDTLVIWLLMGFIGAVYWFLPKELGREVVGIWLAEAL